MRWSGVAVVLCSLAVSAADAAAPPAPPARSLPADFSAALQNAIAAARYKGEVSFDYHCIRDGQNCLGSVELLARVDIKATRSVAPRDCGPGSMPADRCYRAEVYNGADKNLWEIDLNIRPPAEAPYRVTMTARPLPAP